MTTVTIKETQNPTILKFEFEDFITQNESYEFKTLTTQIISSCTKFISPSLRKTVYISNFIALKNIALWNGMM
jgi:hypothetical protein